MKHKYKITDATKQELIDYFFGFEGLGGGYRIPASHKAMKEYIKFIHQANDTKDIDEKLEILEKANNAYKRYENFNKQYELTNKKLDKALGL